jgi:D-beta-D-heptose 7-phosphate kinase/D-beta-D-heptose 1-phosphate adenosyltransferase
MKNRLVGFLPKFRDCRVAVLGDLMLDAYIWGRASRLSQEAPVPVVRAERDTTAPGGAANVVRNLVSLGAKALAFGLVGDDSAGHELLSALEAGGADTSGVVVYNERPTTLKTRVLAGNQQVVRIDREVTDPIPDVLRNQIAERLKIAVKDGRVDAVILEDYAKGVLTKEMVAEVVDTCRQAGVFVTLDPHASNRFEVPGLKLMTPNRAEAFALAGMYYQSGTFPLTEDASLLAVGRQLRETWQTELLLVTLGSKGMALFADDERPIHIPTQAVEVFDVSGAGDTVMAVFVLALASGASPTDAACLANSAAGVVVAEVGTAAVSPEELKHALLELHTYPTELA